MPEMDDDRLADLVDEQLRYLRGEGPPPDLTGLTDDEQAEVLEVLDVVDAQNSYSLAEAAKVDAALRYHVAFGQLQTLTGKLQ